MSVTRLEIADHIGEVFQRRPVSRSELLAEATRTSARPELITLLEQLPEQSYSDLRALWPHLVEVPVDA